MVASDPRNVVREVVNGRCAGQRARESDGREHKAEADRVVSRIALLTKSFSCHAVTERVDDAVCQRPRVTSHEPRWVRPDVWRRAVRKLLFAREQVVNYVGSKIRLLFVV